MIRKVVIVVLTLGAVGCIVLWATSYRPGFYTEAPTLVIRSLGLTYRAHRGALIIDRSYCPSCGRIAFEHAPECMVPAVIPFPGFSSGHDLAMGGFRYQTFSIGAHLFYQCTVPLPWCTAFVLVYPTLCFIRGPVRRWRRRRRGECVACGYNLTENVSGVCPECGAEILDEQRKELGDFPTSGEA